MGITPESNTAENQVQTALQAGIALAQTQELGAARYILRPEGSQVEDLQRFMPAPYRKAGAYTLHDVAGFIDFVRRYADQAHTTIWCEANPPKFVAVLNDHAGEGNPAGWGDLRGTYSCPLSEEWKTWMGMSGKQVNQEMFAAFIENNLPDIAQPPAADMLEISRSLEAKKKVNFASGIRLANGQNQLTYEEEISGTANKGQLQVPEVFTLGIPVLQGGLRYAVEARLRYRIADGGKLTMWYELVRPHKILEDAVNEVRQKIADETGFKLINGTPGDARK